MSKKIYCSISNHNLSPEINSDKLNYLTYIKLLEYFDEVHIYGRTHNGKSYTKKDEYSCVYMHYVSVPKNFFLRYIITILKLFVIILKDYKKYNFSIFDASEPTTGGIIGSILKAFVKKPFLLQIQGELTRISPKTNGFIMAFGTKIITLFCTKFATKIRVVSEIIKKQLIEDGVDEKKIVVLHPRVNLELFHYEDYVNSSIQLKKEFKIDKNKKLLLFVGRLVSFKGVKYLIKACKELNKDEYHLLIVGDGDLKEKLNQLTNELNLEKNITFVGKVEFTKVPYFMAGADIFILPSLDEGFGRVILESMAVKTLVIASKVGGIQDVIVNNETGFFMNPADPASIANKIKEVISMNIVDVDKIIERAYNNVNNNYEFTNSMNRFIYFYDEMVHFYENS